MRQQSYQIVSDNPTCFSVATVSDSRRALKLLDPLLLESFRQQFWATPRASGTEVFLTVSATEIPCFRTVYAV